MITLGYIINKKSGDDYKWWVNIPTLHGVPDNKEEKKMFDAYNEYQKQVSEQKEEPKPLTAFQRLLQALIGRVEAIKPAMPTEEDLQFMTEASVCGLPGSKILYSPGDAVVVGFLDNSISQPIILGSYLTSGREYFNNESKIYLDIEKSNCLSPTAEFAFPLSTRFVDPNNDSRQIDATQIENAIKFINNLESMGFNLQGFSKLLSVVGQVTALVPGMDNIFNLTLPEAENDNTQNTET